MPKCNSCKSALLADLAAAFCPYYGQSLNDRTPVEPPTVEVLAPDAIDLPARRRPTVELAPLPQRPEPPVYAASPPAQPYYAPSQPPQPYYAPPPQPIQITVTQTQGRGFLGNCFTVLGVLVFLLFLLPFLCGFLSVVSSAGGAYR